MIRPVSRNGQELYIRPLRAMDADRLLSFIVALSPTSRRLFRPHAFTREDAVRTVREAQTEMSTRLVIVHPHDEAIIGYGYFTESGVADARVPLLGLVIADRYQNQGLGRALMDALFAEARSQGKAGIQLTVFKENARAIHLYTTLGFRIVGDADGGKQHAMRLDLDPSGSVVDQRGIFLHAVPRGLTRLTLDTWTAPEWIAYLDFLRAAGTSLVKILVWPAHYYHPDEPATLPNAWRYGVLRQALEHARTLGMKTYVGFFLNGVPPSVWHARPEGRAAEVGYRGSGLCWQRASDEIRRFPAFLMDALARCADGFVLWIAGPAFCACPECRDYTRVVRAASEAYTRLLDGRAGLHLSLVGADQLDRRLGGELPAAITPALAEGRFVLVSHDDARLRSRLAGRGVPLLLCDPAADASGENAALPRPRLRQVDHLVVQNTESVGVLGHCTMPRVQFVSDFVLLQRLQAPARGNHEVLRDLGARLFDDAASIFGFARAVWALESWWDAGRTSDLSEARDGLDALPADRLGLARPLRDAVGVLFEIARYLEGGERHFDALVTRVHARMAESPLFQGYTLDQVWQARALAVVAQCVSGWVDSLREHLARTAP
ncbi:MAG: GNAT family N-acetyltransferase [Armatimonadetes bacterium]|nr:GNAT family N-acetyltransferase [Armatimonadota bacterium]